MTSCGVFSKSRCDRCPEFTEYQYENLEIGEDTEFSAHLDAALDPSNNSN